MDFYQSQTIALQAKNNAWKGTFTKQRTIRFNWNNTTGCNRLRISFSSPKKLNLSFLISTIKPSLNVIPFPLLQIELTICVKLNCLLEFYDGSFFYEAKTEIWRSFVGLIMICCKWVTFIKILGTLEVTTDAKIEK